MVQEKEEVILNYRQMMEQAKQESERCKALTAEYQNKEEAIKDYVENVKRENFNLKQEN